MCLDKPDGLRGNDGLEDIAEHDLESGKISRLTFKTWGDAFVFKRVKELGSEGSLGEYVDMDEEFVTSADNAGDAHTLIRNLLLHPTRREGRLVAAMAKGSL